MAKMDLAEAAVVVPRVSMKMTTQDKNGALSRTAVKAAPAASPCVCT